METLAIGKPVIGADIGGIPELVINDRSGLTYKYDSVEELSNKMKELFKNEELVKEFGTNAKKQANELYGKDVYYKNIISIYEKLVK